MGNRPTSEQRVEKRDLGGWAIVLEDPSFRGFWLGTSLLFGNAAFFAPSFEVGRLERAS